MGNLYVDLAFLLTASENSLQSCLVVKGEASSSLLASGRGRRFTRVWQKLATLLVPSHRPALTNLGHGTTDSQLPGPSWHCLRVFPESMTYGAHWKCGEPTPPKSSTCLNSRDWCINTPTSSASGGIGKRPTCFPGLSSHCPGRYLGR